MGGEQNDGLTQDEARRTARELLTAYPGTFPPHAPDAFHIWGETLARVLRADITISAPVVGEMARITYLAAIALAQLNGVEHEDALADLFVVIADFDAEYPGDA
ncbi:MAG: hypothetical protein WA484_10260 [Solirubrobacteraceae bacterium]